MGVVPGWLPRTAPVPWLSRTFARFPSARYQHIRSELADFIALVVSQDNSCRYCYGIQRALFKVFGYPDERIDQLERDLHTADLPPGERAALDFARKLSRANPRPGPGDVEALRRAGFDDAGIAEVAYTAAAASVMNRCATLLALPPERFESIVRRPVFRLLRPFVARRMRRHKPPTFPPPPRPDRGPCAKIVAALGDVARCRRAAAHRRRGLGAPVLPRRTKALVLAVVGPRARLSASETRGPRARSPPRALRRRRRRDPRQSRLAAARRARSAARAVRARDGALPARGPSSGACARGRPASRSDGAPRGGRRRLARQRASAAVSVLLDAC